MTTKVVLALGPALLLISAACSPAPEQAEAPLSIEETAPVEVPDSMTAALDRARSATDRLGQRLMTELGEQLASGSAAAAIGVCSEIAPAAARELGSLGQEGLEIRRTSLRTRNPENEPDAWERAWLERFEESLAAGDLPDEIHEVDEVTRELRYLRPIVVGAPCLACHGEAGQLDAEVRRQLDVQYPKDRATGFAVGDLRGAFTVRVRQSR